MSYRDDRDALLAQAEALRRAMEAAEARAEISEEERLMLEGELATLRRELARLRARRPGQPGQPAAVDAPAASPPVTRAARTARRAVTTGYRVPPVPWPPPRFGVPRLPRELDLTRPGTWALLIFVAGAVVCFGLMITRL